MNTVSLPAAISAYLAAHQAGDVAGALAVFAPDGLVRDDGHTYRGTSEIRDWLGSAGAEYSFTTTLTDAVVVDAGRYDVLQRLEGNFPGGVVDLHYRFTLQGGAVSELVIEP